MSSEQPNQLEKVSPVKDGILFVFIELCVFLAQVLMIFLVAFLISDSLSSEERLRTC